MRRCTVKDNPECDLNKTRAKEFLESFYLRAGMFQANFDFVNANTFIKEDRQPIIYQRKTGQVKYGLYMGVWNRMKTLLKIVKTEYSFNFLS